jgi:glycosyltransferase involved in cell wall biosynthesis
MFVYWGRRGLTQFALEVATAAMEGSDVSATISVSRQNEDFGAFTRFGPALFPIDTFATNSGALTQSWRIPLLRRSLVNRLKKDRTQAVIDLMPHVWSVGIMPAVRAAGVRHVAIVHDAVAHPGDYRTGGVKSILDRGTRDADLVLTLSSAVAGRLVAAGRVPSDKIYPLFHPDLGYCGPTGPSPPPPAPPFRLLFLGRIMPYKGLPLFLDAVESLRGDGIPLEFGVFGEGSLGPHAERLKAMGGELANRWLTGDEISSVLARYHAVVLSHTEASQSGVAAAAHGAGRPVIATPVGGLIEQINDGQTGIVALRAESHALADAAKRLFLDPGLYRAIQENIVLTRSERSMARFVEDCVSHALYAPAPAPI